MYYLSRSKFVRSSYFLEVAAIEKNLDSSNPGTSKHPHMSNRIYDKLDSEYRVYSILRNVSWVLKRTVSTKRLFLCIQTHFFCKTRTECKIIWKGFSDIIPCVQFSFCFLRLQFYFVNYVIVSCELPYYNSFDHRMLLKN